LGERKRVEGKREKALYGRQIACGNSSTIDMIGAKKMEE
jgi:hypothetical protein